MRMRVLLVSALAVTASIVTPGAHAISPCKAAALAETGASDIVEGHFDYRGTLTPGTVPSIVTETERARGTVTGYLLLAGKACSNITYTITAFDEEYATKNVSQPTKVLLASTTTYVKSGDGKRIDFSLVIPEHSGTEILLEATTSAATVIDRAPNDDTQKNVLAINDGSGGGNQYWN